MAVTTYGVNDALAVKLWSRKLAVEVSKATPIAPLIGTSANSIIQEKDEISKGPGDTVTFGLRRQLVGDGVSENQTLEGNEEILGTYSDKLVVNELDHAVRVKNEGTIDAQRVPFNLRDEASAGLTDWFADRLSLMFFLQVCGYNGLSITFEGRVIQLRPVHYGFNALLAPSAGRIVRPNSKTTDESLTTGDEFDLRMLDRMLERAKLANPRIRPVSVDGEKVYVVYLHPTQVTTLRTATGTGQWLDITKSAWQGRDRDNPIFSGALGMYNGMVIREAEHVTTGVNSTTGAEVPNVRRAVLLGAQAAVVGFSQNNSPTKYQTVEELFDYQRELGVAVKTVMGMKKTQFGTGTNNAQVDFGVIVLSTYAPPN